MSTSERSKVLPSDPFDILLNKLIGLPNGAHVQPAVIQAIDTYGNVTSFMVQSVRDDNGPTVFVTQVNATGSLRFILPPSVLRLIDRQRDAMSTTIRRRHGKRLAEARASNGNPFTPEMRAKALATRKRKAAQRAKRRTA